jgi:hypothetical protein
MYTNNFIKVKKTLFDSGFAFFIILYLHFIFVKWLKNTYRKYIFNGRAFYNLKRS